jgi:hypothetical protein
MSPKVVLKRQIGKTFVEGLEVAVGASRGFFTKKLAEFLYALFDIGHRSFSFSARRLEVNLILVPSIRAAAGLRVKLASTRCGWEGHNSRLFTFWKQQKEPVFLGVAWFDCSFRIGLKDLFGCAGMRFQGQ